MKKILSTLLLLLVSTLAFSSTQYIVITIPKENNYSYRLEENENWIEHNAQEPILIEGEVDKIYVKTTKEEVEVKLTEAVEKQNTINVKLSFEGNVDSTQTYKINGVEHKIEKSELELEDIPNGSEIEIVETHQIIKPYYIDLSKKRERNFTFRAALMPLNIEIVDFYNGRNIANAKALTSSKASKAFSFELGYNFNKIYTYAAIDRIFTERKETVIPDAHLVKSLILTLGADYNILNIKNFSLAVGAMAGLKKSENANIKTDSFIFGLRCHLDYQITEFFSLGLLSKASFSHMDSAYELYKSWTYLIDGLALVATVKF